MLGGRSSKTSLITDGVAQRHVLYLSHVCFLFSVASSFGLVFHRMQEVLLV